MIIILLIIQTGRGRQAYSRRKCRKDSRLRLSGAAGKGVPTMALLGEWCWGNVFAPLVPKVLLRTLILKSQQHPPPQQTSA